MKKVIKRIFIALLILAVLQCLGLFVVTYEEDQDWLRRDRKITRTYCFGIKIYHHEVITEQYTRTYTPRDTASNEDQLDESPFDIASLFNREDIIEEGPGMFHSSMIYKHVWPFESAFLGGANGE